MERTGGGENKFNSFRSRQSLCLANVFNGVTYMYILLYLYNFLYQLDIYQLC